MNDLNNNPTLATPDWSDALDAMNIGTDVDLVSDELEDRFNAGNASTASTAGTLTGCWGTASSICSLF